MNTVKTVFLMSSLVVLLILLGHMFGGTQGATIAFVIALGINFVSYFFSDRIVLSMYGARELAPSEAGWLHASAVRIAERAGIPVPRLYVIDSPQPNAFATGRSPSRSAVAFSQGLLKYMNREEVEGVLAHEIAHIRNRDTLTGMIAAAFAGAVMYLGDMARWAMFFGGGRDDENRGGGVVHLLVMAILAPLAATMIQLAISRSREYAADETAARLTGSPLGLAAALEKLGYASQRIPMEAAPATASLFIVNPLSGGGLLSLFSTHPPLESRIRRLYELAGLAR